MIMSELLIKSTRTTPEVSFQPNTGVLSIEGRSSPENAPNFYLQITKSLEQLSEYDTPKLTANFMLEYFNTSSSRCFLDLFRQIERISKQSKEVEVNWYFEEDDDDIREQGEDFAEFVAIPFNIREVEFFG
jgi:hypothetical protein